LQPIGAGAPIKGTLTVLKRPNPREADTFGRPLPRTTVEDAELVAQVKRGETQAYGELVRRYQDRVFNTCWRICGHLEDARDLTQDAFLKAYEGLSSFRGDSGFFTWVFRVAVNLALTHRRRGRNRRVVSLDQAAEGEGEPLEPLVFKTHGEAQDDPAEGPSQTELHSALGRALQSLDDDQRAVVVLRDIEGFDYDRIAAILQVPAGTVKSRLFRARMALQRAVEPLEGGTT